MRASAPEALERARRVRLMIFDVDGVLTDGRLWYGPAGEELKGFHGFDGQGIRMLGATGVKTAIITGRQSAAVASRALELGIEHVRQGVARKREAFEDLLRGLALAAQDAGYMGDDLPDLPVLTRCGLACAPREARAGHVRARAAGLPRLKCSTRACSPSR
jgi:3-deoxy-D-manno-octulosonate 8-phosphate phosphatase (KDO 8-P phosphatase)